MEEFNVKRNINCRPKGHKKMKRILKISLITITVIIGLLVLAWGGKLLKVKSETSKFTPLATGHVVDDIFAVKDDFTNVFFIKDGTRYIVIDCGKHPKTIREQMKTLGINPDDVPAVFLTHTDGDHVGGLGLFGRAKLYISKEEEQMINGKKSRYLCFGNSISRSDYTLLKDRETVQIGNLKFEVFLAPGHTSGMTAYLVNGRYLFSGDIASLKDGRIAPIPAFFDMDREQAVKSHEIIRHIPTAEYIFTGHWGYTGDYPTAVEQ
jgi:glyoxylase-like metal-dependent hydrolase (beta-lactamase superfamily II)